MAEADAAVKQDERSAYEALPPEEQEAARRSFLLRRFWRSALGFWGKGGLRRAWLLSFGLVAVIVLTIVIQYGINVWNRAFFDALERKDGAASLRQALIFVPLIVTSVLLSVANVYARMSTQRVWRRWLTSHVVDYWLAKGRYFQLNLVRGDHKNPEYRIADDLRLSTDAPVDFAYGMLSAILSAATFIFVLWSIGGALTFELGGRAITIPGFLVVAAVIYAVLASGSMIFIGRRFVEVAENKNQAEAEYRYVLTRLRENGESIALLGGEQEERAGLDKSLAAVLRRWRHLCFQHMRTTVVSQSSAQLAPVIPVLLCAPKYLDGSMSLGQVMQAASAFVIVQTAFSWIVDNYPRFADWTASARRLASLLVSLDALDEAEKEGLGYITQGATSDAAMKLVNLSVTLDDGTSVINDTEVTIMPGEKVLVVGESGTGKSSLVRAIAGLWPWGGGEILFQHGAKLFLLPQRPYIPVGSLRRATAYPTPADEVDAKAIAEALEAVGLGQFVERMDEETNWDQTLSGGEKQRLAFARLLIQRPTIVVLDEATSALDPSSQELMMNLLAERLPETTVMSVGHRPELEAFHERKLTMGSHPEGARLIGDVDLVAKSGTKRKRHRFRWRGRRRGTSKLKAA
jgi:vitamin B12/bleomycin/antimicrobial peptide transport system ATP-binding/permease protein